jgi:hypothetical protein
MTGTQTYFDITLFNWDNRNYAWHALVLPVKPIRESSFTDAVSVSSAKSWFIRSP